MLLAVAAVIATGEFDLCTSPVLECEESVEEREKRRLRRQLDFESFSAHEGTFRVKFRISLDVFDYILSLINHALSHKRNFIPPNLQLAMFLEYAGRGVDERYLMAGYGCTTRMCHDVITRVTKALCDLDCVRWPSLEEQKQLAIDYNKYQPLFDGGIGCVDGTHVMVRECGLKKVYCVNRKGWPSVSLMCVVDIHLRFTHITYGAAGRVHDARVFSESALPAILNDPARTNPYFYVFGDAAYGSRARVLVPASVVVNDGQSR